MPDNSVSGKRYASASSSSAMRCMSSPPVAPHFGVFGSLFVLHKGGVPGAACLEHLLLALREQKKALGIPRAKLLQVRVLYGAEVQSVHEVVG
jgi:hypothetical protein